MAPEKTAYVTRCTCQNREIAAVTSPRSYQVLELLTTQTTNSMTGTSTSTPTTVARAALGEDVFQPFITTKPHGLGMGLTISRELIGANGGKLWHSQENGQGVTFHFTLPIPDKTNVVQEALT